MLMYVAGVGLAEREVLDLPLALPDPEAARERGVELQALAGQALALGTRTLARGAQPVQGQRELHDQDPHVVHDGEQQPAQPFRLFRPLRPRVPAGGGGVPCRERPELVEPEQPLHERRRLRAEMLPHRVDSHGAALDEEAGKARGDAAGIQVQLREHLRRPDPRRRLSDRFPGSHRSPDRIPGRGRGGTPPSGGRRRARAPDAPRPPQSRPRPPRRREPHRRSGRRDQAAGLHGCRFIGSWCRTSSRSSLNRGMRDTPIAGDRAGIRAEVWCASCAGRPDRCEEMRPRGARPQGHTRRIAATTRPMMLILSILRSQAS